MMTGNVVAIVAGGVICAAVSYFTFDQVETWDVHPDPRTTKIRIRTFNFGSGVSI